MRPHPYLPPAIVALTSLLFAAAPPAGAGHWEVEEHQTIEKTLFFETTSTSAAASDSNLLVVDNVSGPIRVTAHDGPEVHVLARETLRARSKSHLERARREAGLVIDAQGDTIYLVVDGPFRAPDGGLRWRHRDLGYEFHYDFEIQLPRKTRLELETVHEGDVEVEGVAGRFDVANVNGAIVMTHVAGHGRAQTVNGGIDASFTARPDGECDFETVNGDIDVDFPGDLAADLRLKTMNGDVYTDFDYTPLASSKAEPRRKGGRTVWKSLGTGARIGGGGPKMSFETMNGNVYIRNTDR